MNISQSVFDPGLITTLTVDAVKREKDNPGFLKTNIEKLDNHYVMFRDRRVNGIMAGTSHGKTSFMSFLARQFLPQLKENEIVLWVTWEDSIEDFGMNNLASMSKIPVASLFHGDVTMEQWGRMISAAAQRAAQPLWAMGHSETLSYGRPRLTMTDVWEGVKYIQDVQGKKIRAIFLDYLQRVNTDDTGERNIREAFMKTMDKVKDLALDRKLPRRSCGARLPICTSNR